MEIVSDVRCFEGRQLVVTHPSDTTKCDMTFGLYLPPEAEYGPVPVIWYLSGLTCTHENAMTKAGLQAVAAEGCRYRIPGHIASWRRRGR
jgi:S-formylglutathione hydrolase